MLFKVFTKLGDIAISEKGKKPIILINEKKSGYIPYINIEAFEKKVFNKYTDGYGCRLCDEGDVLIVWDGSRSGLVGRAYKGAIGSTIAKIQIPYIKNDYLYYFLIGKYLILNTRTKGTGTPHVDPAILWNFDFPIISNVEQTRIVEKIEELFSDLDKATEDLKKTQEQLKIYRQAVLEAAFGSILEKNIFEIKTIEEIITEKQIGLVRSNKEQNSTSTGVPYIKMNNINTLGDVDINDVVYVEVNDEELGKYKLKKNDLLINTRNSFELVGKSGIVKDDNVERVFNNNILRVRFNNSIIPKFVNYQLLSNEIRQQIRKEKKATTNVCALYQRDILPLKFKIPKINIQNDIVNYVEYKLSVCDKLEKTVQQSLKKIEYLCQSILKKAFEGKLVSQDPNDLPACELLKQIKNKKDKMSKNGK